MIELCKKIATKYHEGQYRLFGVEKGDPYIKHPERVAKIVESMGGTQEEICAGWLHDVIEDCDIDDYYLLELGVDPKIVHTVQLLTHDRTISYLQYILKITTNKSATCSFVFNSLIFFCFLYMQPSLIF